MKRETPLEKKVRALANKFLIKSRNYKAGALAACIKPEQAGYCKGVGMAYGWVSRDLLRLLADESVRQEEAENRRWQKAGAEARKTIPKK